MTQVKRLPADEYGILFWMVKHDFNLIADVVKDAGGINCLDVIILFQPDTVFRKL